MSEPQKVLLVFMERANGSVYSQSCCSCGQQIIATAVGEPLTDADKAQIRAHADDCRQLHDDIAHDKAN